MGRMVLMAGGNKGSNNLNVLMTAANVTPFWVGRQHDNFMTHYLHDNCFHTLNGIGGAILLSGSVCPIIKIRDWIKDGEEVMVVFNLPEMGGQTAPMDRSRLSVKWQSELCNYLTGMKWGQFQNNGIIIGTKRTTKPTKSEVALDLVRFTNSKNIPSSDIIKWIQNAPKTQKEDWKNGYINSKEWQNIQVETRGKKHHFIEEIVKDVRFEIPSVIGNDAAFKCAAGGASDHVKIKNSNGDTMIGRVFNTTIKFKKTGVDDDGNAFSEKREKKIDVFSTWDSEGNLLTTRPFD